MVTLVDSLMAVFTYQRYNGQATSLLSHLPTEKAQGEGSGLYGNSSDRAAALSFVLVGHLITSKSFAT